MMRSGGLWLDRVTVAGQQRLEEIEILLLVIDDEDAGHRGFSGGRAAVLIRLISATKVSGLMGFSM